MSVVLVTLVAPACGSKDKTTNTDQMGPIPDGGEVETADMRRKDTALGEVAYPGDFSTPDIVGEVEAPEDAGQDSTGELPPLPDALEDASVLDELAADLEDSTDQITPIPDIQADLPEPADVAADLEEFQDEASQPEDTAETSPDNISPLPDVGYETSPDNISPLPDVGYETSDLADEKDSAAFDLPWMDETEDAEPDGPADSTVEAEVQLECGPDTCSGHGDCSAAGGTVSCDCDEGYQGKSCNSCSWGWQDYDGDGECDFTCWNKYSQLDCGKHGECDDSSGEALCACEEGYKGYFCHLCAWGYFSIGDDCLPNEDCGPAAAVCSGHGECSLVNGKPVCECEPEYEGDFCEECKPGYQDNDEDGICHPSCDGGDLACGPQGECEDDSGPAVCVCNEGHAGPACEDCQAGYQDNDGNGQCQPGCLMGFIYCSAHGSCSDLDGEAKCECYPGWGGDACDECLPGYHPDGGLCIEDSQCQPESCNGHGKCSDGEGYPKCWCDFGYQGEFCDQCADDFQDNDGDGACMVKCGTIYIYCGFNTYCDDSTGVAQCLCEPGYSPPNCFDCADGYHKVSLSCVADEYCTPASCSGHGECDDSSGVVKCVCEPGHMGGDCGKCTLLYQDNDNDGACEPICLIAGLNCSYHGYCDDSGGSPVCACIKGFTGDECQECEDGYHPLGNNCKPDESCQPDSCSLHGTCSDNGGIVVCDCKPCYAGKDCSKCSDLCQDHDGDGVCITKCANSVLDCHGHGTCSDWSGTPVCICDFGYAGDECQDCVDGYHPLGDDCEPDIKCNPFSCSGHGDCFDGGGIPVCTCHAGYQGAKCEQCANGYQDNDGNKTCELTCTAAGYDCSGHGYCDEGSGVALCVCDEGFGGLHCSDCAKGYYAQGDACVPVEECAEDTCSYHGQCSDDAGFPACMCDQGYQGKFCGSCEEGYQDKNQDGQCEETCGESGLDCGMHGVCSDADGVPACACDIGWTGDKCTDCADGFHKEGPDCAANTYCKADSCSGHGQCDATAGFPQCICSAGYQGEKCEQCADGYQDNDNDGTCLAACGELGPGCVDGQCLDASGEAVCVCDYGYQGTLCDQCLETEGGVELCDGLDNDCDGLIDAADPDVHTKDLPLVLKDDDSAAIELCRMKSFPFCGQEWTSLVVDSNGRLMFGFDKPNSLETKEKFISQGPQIAMFWDDLATSAQNVTYTETEDQLTITFDQIKEYGTDSGSNTFSVVLKSDGSMVMSYGDMISKDGLVGWSCGEGGDALDLSAWDVPDGSAGIGQGTEAALFEVFTPAHPNDLAGRTLQFCVQSGEDGDGDKWTGACGDCNDDSPQAHPLAKEVCDNDQDDDCNGKADCDEAICYYTDTCFDSTGDTCDAPYHVNNGQPLMPEHLGVEFQFQGATVGMSNDYAADNDAGGTSPDVAFRFQLKAVAVATVTLETADGMAGVAYIRHKCDDPDSLALAATTDGVATFDVLLPKNSYYIIVDGHANSSAGAYSLTLILNKTAEVDCWDGLDNDLDGLVDCEDGHCSKFLLCHDAYEPNDTEEEAWDLGDMTSMMIEVAPASIHSVLDQDYFRFEITEKQVVTIVATPSPELNPKLRFHDPAWDFLQSKYIGTIDKEGAGKPEVFQIWLNEPGEYHVSIETAAENSTGTYTLSLGLADQQLFETHCSDGYDNNHDGLVDCDDPDCSQVGACPDQSCSCCGDGVCDAFCGENLVTCYYDCGECGDGICRAPEKLSVCPEDCCGTCGDHRCMDEKFGCLENSATCPADCGELEPCGNGICEPGELDKGCLEDCDGTVCGDGICERGENPESCADDCAAVCGDCACDGGEGDENCPEDCGWCGDGVCSNCPDRNENVFTCFEDCGECLEQCTNEFNDEECCVFCCEPDCEGKECGDDGCGGNCAQCPMGIACTDGECQNQWGPTGNVVEQPDDPEPGEPVLPAQPEPNPVSGLGPPDNPVLGPWTEPDCCGECGDGVCNILCKEDAYSCPEDCSIGCGNGLCEQGESFYSDSPCLLDCFGVCGDGICSNKICVNEDFGENEDPFNCPLDCQAAACGDGLCSFSEGLNLDNPCLPDCAKYGCGNGVCEQGESAIGDDACIVDCGSACGDCVCAGGEDNASCRVDCGWCGDGVCSPCPDMVESPETCPADCGHLSCGPVCECDNEGLCCKFGFPELVEDVEACIECKLGCNQAFTDCTVPCNEQMWNCKLECAASQQACIGDCDGDGACLKQCNAEHLSCGAQCSETGENCKEPCKQDQQDCHDGCPC